MRRKHFYNNEGRGQGRGRGRGRGGNRRGFGPRVGAWEGAGRGGWGAGFGPWQDWEEMPRGYGPPPWAPRWGWNEETPETPDAFYGPPPWSGGGMWRESEITADSRQAWLQARKARLLAWKQHLDARLAETEAELAKFDEPENASDETPEVG